MVTLECYCPKRDGSFNYRALRITFATKTPLVVWFEDTRPCAFKYGSRGTVLLQGTTRRLLRKIVSDGDESKTLGIGGFNWRLKELVIRLFEPPDLDKDTPPLVVADWLQDRGLETAAHKVREAHSQATGTGDDFEPGRMLQVTELIEELQNLLAKWGNTCVYVKDLSWGSVALNRQAADADRTTKDVLR